LGTEFLKALFLQKPRNEGWRKTFKPERPFKRCGGLALLLGLAACFLQETPEQAPL
jgi:hypothetical protein